MIKSLTFLSCSYPIDILQAVLILSTMHLTMKSINITQTLYYTVNLK